MPLHLAPESNDFPLYNAVKNHDFPLLNEAEIPKIISGQKPPTFLCIEGFTNLALEIPVLKTWPLPWMSLNEESGKTITYKGTLPSL